MLTLTGVRAATCSLCFSGDSLVTVLDPDTGRPTIKEILKVRRRVDQVLALLLL